MEHQNNNSPLIHKLSQTGLDGEIFKIFDAADCRISLVHGTKNFHTECTNVINYINTEKQRLLDSKAYDPAKLDRDFEKGRSYILSVATYYFLEALEHIE